MKDDVVDVQERNLVEVPPIGDETLIQLAEQAEKRVDALNKIKRAALKATNPRDWTDQNGNPYLQVSGSEKVGRIFGISWRIGEPTFEQEEGGHYSYTYSGNFTVAGATINVIGTRSSKDGFFKKYDYSEKDANGKSVKKDLPPSEIDRGDVKKAAYTNCIGNGVTRLLGLRNLTWEDLKEFAGITKEQVTAIQYKKEGKKQDKDIKSEGASTVSAGISDIRKQTGTSKQTGKPWTKYIIKTEDAEYITFSATLAGVAKEAHDAGLQVEITFKAGEYGNDIEAIKKVEP